MIHARRPGIESRRAGGFTLLELIVSIGIFSMLGLLLVPMLASGINQWQDGEARREVYERGHMVLQRIEDDLQSLFSAAGPRAGGESRPVEVVLLCDRDGAGRQRLRFVRTLKGEDADPANAGAGAGRPQDGYTEYRTTLNDVGKKLRTLKGLSEVAYCIGIDADKRNTLYRGERSPIGGEGSLFTNELLAEQKALEERALPIADNLLLCRFLFWSQFTTTWSEDASPGRGFGGDGGPHPFWDSTRGILPFPPRKRSRARGGYFDLALDSGSRNDPIDDIFPSMVQIQIVLASLGPNRPYGTLTADLGDRDRQCQADTHNFPEAAQPGFSTMMLKIDDEWMEYNRVDGLGFKLGKRGLLGTRAAKHAEGAEIRTGIMFTKAIPIPARRNYWNK